MIGGQLAPKPFTPNTCDKTFEVAILLKIDQDHIKKNSGSPKSPYGPGASVVS